MDLFAKLSSGLPHFGEGNFKVYTPNEAFTLVFSSHGFELYEIDREGRVRLVGDEEVNRILGGKVLIASFVNGAVFMNNGEIQEIPQLDPYTVVAVCMYGEYTLVVTYSMLFVFKETALVLTRNTREIEDFSRVERWEVSHVSNQFRIVSRETGDTLWTYETWEYTPEMKSIVEEAFDRYSVPVDCLRVVEAMLA